MGDRSYEIPEGWLGHPLRRMFPPARLDVSQAETGRL